MPFDQLAPRLSPENLNVEHAQVQPAPPVFPIDKIVESGVKNVDNILQTFGPMAQEEKKAAIAKLALTRLAYEAGAKGDTRLLEVILGHQSQQLLTPRDIYNRTYWRKKAEQDAAGGGGPDENTRKTADELRKAKEAEQANQHGPIGGVKITRVSNSGFNATLPPEEQPAPEDMTKEPIPYTTGQAGQVTPLVGQ